MAYINNNRKAATNYPSKQPNIYSSISHNQNIHISNHNKTNPLTFPPSHEPIPPIPVHQTRDKTKSYFQPTSHNLFSTSQVHSQSSTVSHHSSSSAYQSDKYKSYYTEFQDFKPQQNGFYVTSNNNPPLQRQKSYERNRFYTVAEHERKDFVGNDHPLGNLQEDNFSQSMIVMTNRPTSINKEEASSKKDAYKFAASKFSSSRIESQYNSREKKPDSHSQNKSEYLDRANKKVSLKRDIAPISPKYQQQNSNANTTPKYPPSQPSFINISNRFNINQNSNAQNNTQNNAHNNTQSKVHQNTSVIHHQNSMPFLPYGNDQSSVFAQNLSQIHQRQTLQNSQKGFNQQMIIPSTLQRFSNSSQTSDLSINRRNSDKQGKQLSFKKTSKKGQVSTYEAQRAVSTYDPQRTTPSSQSSSVAANHFTSQVSNNTDDNTSTQNKGRSPQSKPFFGSIRSNSSKQRQPSTQQLIDSQVLTDMKISRIQQSTSNLQQKLLTLTLTLQQLLHQSKQHQTSITSINTYITHQQQQGLTPHDIKRIKKQLKIMKTNFQTAFTSMTEQINRKLIKEQNIMRSLSEQIGLVAEENVKLGEAVERRSRKVESLEKSMTSFMRQNQQRMENLVLNESFSSSKRSKNHSFEYGLDLKNMSSDDNYASGKSYNLDGNTSKKIESIQKEISKMKVFHIKQQESYLEKFDELKRDIEKATNDQQKYIVRTDAQHMIRQAVQQILQLKLQTWQTLQSQHSQQKHSHYTQQLHTLKQKLQDLHKICHQELYDFRMNKLQQVPLAPKFVTESKIKTMNSEFEQQLGEVQGKQRGMLITLTDFQQKLISFEDRWQLLHRNFDELKLKQLKHTGDMREVQLSLKQVNHTLHSLNGFKQSTLSSLNELSQLIGSKKGLINTLQARANNFDLRIAQADRINAIQTENIESINNEFERVINKEIIPKIQQVHLGNIDINHKIHSLGADVAVVKKLSGSEGAFGNAFGECSAMQSSAKKPLIDDTQLDKKIQQYLTQNITKFINSKVKLISTKFLSSKSPLSKIGLFKDKKPPSHLHNNYENQPEITKEQTYLVDQDGYLMDWEGAYLMEVDELGNRKKIRVSEEELYFMEVNGLEIRRQQGGGN